MITECPSSDRVTPRVMISIKSDMRLSTHHQLATSSQSEGSVTPGTNERPALVTFTNIVMSHVTRVTQTLFILGARTDRTQSHVTWQSFNSSLLVYAIMGQGTKRKGI